MKILLLPILLFPLFLFGQPVKNDTKIIVTVDTANVYNKIVSELFDKGYSVETKDDGLKFIVSTENVLLLQLLLPLLSPAVFVPT